MANTLNDTLEFLDLKLKHKRLGLNNEEIKRLEELEEVEDIFYKCVINVIEKYKLVLSENDMLTQNNEKLLSENLIYKSFAIELLDKILDEFKKDGWCRLIMKKEDVLRFKEEFELK
ncbi:hypothetical protein DZC34_03340 [Clostridium botulinum]|nr:hypothetical protein DZC34_03340 [Clostridium botulinum]